MLIILGAFFMIVRIVKNPIEEPQQNQGMMLNNMKHNPALVSNMQILLSIGVFIVTLYPAMFVAGKGPNSFILGSLPSAVGGYFVVPVSFYAYNKKLRKYVWKEAKESLGLKNQIDLEPSVGGSNDRF